MGKEDTADLLKFLQPYPGEVQEIALWLREFVWDLYPESNELIYDNYNALAFGWTPSDRTTDTFCSVAVAAKYVHFGFYWGNVLADPEKKLLGNGKQYRYIIVKTKADFPKAYIKKLVREAYAHSLSRILLREEKSGKKEKIEKKGSTQTRASLEVKKRPGVVLKKKKK